MPREKKPQQPSGDRFICRVCRTRKNTVPDHAGDRVCKECAGKSATATATVEQTLAGLAPMLSSPITYPTSRPKPMPFEDASILAEIEEPGPFPLEHLLKGRIEAKSEADFAKTRIDHFNSELLPFLRRNKLSGVVYDGSTVAIMNGRRPTIKKELLLVNGVTADVIAKCTEWSEFETVSVRGPKEEKTDE